MNVLEEFLISNMAGTANSVENTMNENQPEEPHHSTSNPRRNLPEEILPLAVLPLSRQTLPPTLISPLPYTPTISCSSDTLPTASSSSKLQTNSSCTPSIVSESFISKIQELTATLSKKKKKLTLESKIAAAQMDCCLYENLKEMCDSKIKANQALQATLQNELKEFE